MTTLAESQQSAASARPGDGRVDASGQWPGTGRGGAIVTLQEIFVPVPALAGELQADEAAVRGWALQASIPLFRRPGEPRALLRRADVARLRAEAALASPARRDAGRAA
jgi:hypothetical protein